MRLAKHIWWLINILCLFTWALAVISPSAVAQCARDYDDRRFDDGIARIRTYRCETGKATLKVTFHRLSDEAIGSIILGRPLVAIRSMVGDFTLIRNDVHDRARELYERFGTRKSAVASGDGGGGYSISVQTPVGGTEYSGSREPNTSEQTWSLQAMGWDKNIFVPSSLLESRKRKTDAFLPNQSEIANIRRYFEQCRKPASDCTHANKYMRLSNYVGHKDFIVLGEWQSCGDAGVPGHQIFNRTLIMRMATIENLAGTAVSIDRIIGAETSGNISIKSGERVAIPMDLRFSLTEQVSGVTREIKFGPELSFQGVVVGGVPVLLAEQSANYMGITMRIPETSCPYLYALGDGDIEWQSYGKVIEGAIGRLRQMTQVIQLKQFATRFKLREEEPERTFVDAIELRIRTKDGLYFSIKPGSRALQKRDGVYEEIAPYGEIEVEFKLPAWVKKSAIERTTVAITGYYKPELPSSVAANDQVVP